MLAVAVLLFVAFLLTIPYGQRQLARQEDFISIADTLLFLCDLITAALLYAQFSVVRSKGLLALATGYLFTSFIIVPHLLTFPAIFTPTGLLGASLQTTVWLYIFWHLGLPPAATAYALLKGGPDDAMEVRASLRSAILASVVAAATLACSLTWLATAGARFLPRIMIDVTHANSAWRGIAGPSLVALSMTSIVLLWRRRTSVLDLWLLVVLWAWFIETILLSTTASRYTVVWYAGRSFGIVSSGFVLLVLLSESTMLYARLAISVAAQDRERDGRKMTLEIIVRSMAHELQQPLAAISFNSDAAAILLNRNPPELGELRASLADIASDGRRASEIVASTRTMITGVVRHMAPVDVYQLVRETLALSEIELRINEVSVQLQLAPQLPQVHGNRIQLQQVLLNMIANAVESMAAVSGRPRLLTMRAAARTPTAVLIEVEDTGIGIDAQNAERVFEPFFTTKANGTGLGLAICRAIIEAHGGDLAVVPGNPCGCVFHIELPAAAGTRV